MGIMLFGKNIYQYYQHHIMKLDYKATDTNPELHLYKIDLDHISEELESIGTNVTVQNLERLVRINAGNCEGFKFTRELDSVGTIWVMYQGADDMEYRIRNIDAYLFNVFVNEQFRGNGYAGEMIWKLMDHLHEKGIDTAHLAVSVSNENAIRAYEKAGFSTVRDCSFARVLKVNIPYHIL